MRQRSNISVMLKLIVLVKPMIPVMLLAVLTGTFGFFCATLIPVLSAAAALSVIGEIEPISLTAAFGIIIICAILRATLRYTEQHCNHYIAFKVLAEIRGRVFAALRVLAPAKFERRDRGDLISLMTDDIELIEVFYAHTISPILIALLYCSIMVFFLGMLHPIFAVFALLGYLIIGAVLPAINSKTGKNAGKEYRDRFGLLNGFILDSLRGLSEIIRYNRGESRLEALDAKTIELQAIRKKLKRNEAVFKGLTDSVIILTTAAILFAGVFLNLDGEIEFSAVVLAVAAVISSFGAVTALSNLANTLSLTLSCGERVLDLLEETPIIEEITNGRDIFFSGAVCENITFAYGGTPVIRDLSLAVPTGRIFGIKGKSGSGKSTLLNLLMRFWDVDRGKILISDTDIREINTSSLRECESFVTQETHLFHDSIEKNIRISKPDADRDQIIHAAKKAALHDFICTLPAGYDTNVGDLGEKLSSGERQRIGLARAFLHDAPFLLLDEPTNNLDSLSEGIILKAIREESSGKTVVLVSHRESTLRIADAVCFVDNGRVS